MALEGGVAFSHNLAVGECRLGRKGDAEAPLKRLLRFASDDQQGRAGRDAALRRIERAEDGRQLNG
jgi:hypothetical protein